MFIWVALVLVLYPVINLVAVSFSRNDNLFSAPPDEGNILVRAGILPDPSTFSFAQYRDVLGETHILWYQWILIAIFLLAIVGFIATSLGKRAGNARRFERLETPLGWTLFLSAAVLTLSVTPEQFYSVTEGGAAPTLGEQ